MKRGEVALPKSAIPWSNSSGGDHIYQAACGKPVRRAVHLGKKTTQLFQLFHVFRKCTWNRDHFGKSGKVGQKGSGFWNFHLDFLSTARLFATHPRKSAFWRGPNSILSNRCSQTMALKNETCMIKRCLEIHGFPPFSTAWIHVVHRTTKGTTLSEVAAKFPNLSRGGCY